MLRQEMHVICNSNPLHYIMVESTILKRVTKRMVLLKRVRHSIDR